MHHRAPFFVSILCSACAIDTAGAATSSNPTPPQRQEQRGRQLPVALQSPAPREFSALDSASQNLQKRVLDYLGSIGIVGELAIDLVKGNWTQVLTYMLTDNKSGLAQLFSPQALCPSLEKLKANMQSGPLYQYRERGLHCGGRAQSWHGPVLRDTQLQRAD